jgi:hypothetical protein
MDDRSKTKMLTMTDEERANLKRFKISLRYVSTAMSNTMPGFRSLASGAKDPQTRAVYATVVKMTPALIEESRAIADEIDKDLQGSHWRGADAWNSLLRRAQLVSAKFSALSDEINGK